MASRRITTRDQLLKAIKDARDVFIFVRFGCVESEVRITKREALLFVQNCIGASTTPRELEMPTDTFARVDDDNCIFLG